MHASQEKGGDSKYLKSWRSLRKQSLCIIQRSTNFACDSRIPLNHKISYHSNILNWNYSQTISASLDPWHWLVLQLNSRAFCKLLKLENIPQYHVTPRAHKDRNQMQRRNDPRHRSSFEEFFHTFLPRLSVVFHSILSKDFDTPNTF